MDQDVSKLNDTLIEDKIREELSKLFESKRKRLFSKIFGAALGSIPWVGGFLTATKDFLTEEGQIKSNQLYQQWLNEHRTKMKILGETLLQIISRLDDFSEEIDERLESEEYLQIVRKSFRVWDNADTQEKRDLVRKLLTNAGSHKLVSDDLIRLFLDWIATYHEIHFAVIRAVHQNKGITRYEIWQQLSGESVKENSSEADLFKLLIRDLSTGGVIRQHRVTDYSGRFIKKTSPKSSRPSKTLTSAFDDNDNYELTELGERFVHYTMNEIVPRIGNSASEN